jgi:hypothetical protein
MKITRSVSKLGQGANCAPAGGRFDRKLGGGQACHGARVCSDDGRSKRALRGKTEITWFWVGLGGRRRREKAALKAAVSGGHFTHEI